MSKMITHKFRSVTWAAAVAAAALTCYLIAYRVSAERNALETVEREIEAARGDILALNTEFQTRSRMGQLEQWNRNDLALEAPGPRQFIENNTELASLLGRDVPSPVATPEVQNASSEISEGEQTIDEDVFEAPDQDELNLPRLQQASYLVRGRNEERDRAERIAFLDERLRDDIVSEDAVDEAGEGSTEQ